MIKIDPHDKRVIMDSFGWSKGSDGVWRNKRADLHFRDETLAANNDGAFLNLMKMNDTVYGRKKLLGKLGWEWRPSLMGADTIYVKGKAIMTSEWLGNADFVEFILAVFAVRPWSLSVDAIAEGIRAELKEQVNDNISHPSYYTDGNIEVSDFIADKNLNFFRGNVVKYTCRAGKKDPEKEVEDLKKAAWYINREIERLGKTDGVCTK